MASEWRNNHNKNNFKSSKHGALIISWGDGSCVYGETDCKIGKDLENKAFINLSINDTNISNNSPDSKITACFNKISEDRQEIFKLLKA